MKTNKQRRSDSVRRSGYRTLHSSGQVWKREKGEHQANISWLSQRKPTLWQRKHTLWTEMIHHLFFAQTKIFQLVCYGLFETRQHTMSCASVWATNCTFILGAVSRLKPGVVSSPLPALEGGGISNHSNKSSSHPSCQCFPPFMAPGVWLIFYSWKMRPLGV